MKSTFASQNAAVRCPACGERLDDPPPPLCPLCQYSFGDNRVTGEDATPFAHAFSQETGGWRRMWAWVWFAGEGRLKHLALMRASMAARRFAWMNGLSFALALGAFAASRFGWRWVTNSPALDPRTRPVGRGWFHATSAPRPLPEGLAAEVPVDLWWNPVQGLVAGVLGLILGGLLTWFMLVFLRAGITTAFRQEFQKEGRLGAAILYSTAWLVPAAAALLLGTTRPLAYLGSMSKWWWHPPDHGILFSGGIVGGLAAALWWFWMVRLGATTPKSTRGRVVGFMALGIPVLVSAFGTAWWYTVGSAFGWMVPWMNLGF